MNAVALYPSSRGTTARRYFDLITAFAERTIKARYRGSVLGVFWSLSNPLIMTFVYSLIFGTAFKAYYGNSIPNYILAVFMGMVVMSFFSQGSSQALTSVVANGMLVNKIRIPLVIFPISTVAANLFQFTVGVLPVIVGVTIVASHHPSRIVYLAAPALSLLLVTIGASLIVSALFIFFRDLPYLYELILSITYMTSPIFYPEQIVPERLRPFVHLNPIAAIVNDFRQIAFAATVPSIESLAGTIGIALVTLAIGAVVFATLQKWAMDLL